MHTLLARWPLLVGPVNAAHSRPEAYADAVLTVRTDSTAWATQLRLMAPQLVALLNDHLGDGTDHPGHHPGPGRAVVEEGPPRGTRRPRPPRHLRLRVLARTTPRCSRC